MSSEIVDSAGIFEAENSGIPVCVGPKHAGPRGRRITLKEARRIALEVLEQAEQERSELARREAAHEMVWESPT
jgi:hypothetical protein